VILEALAAGACVLVNDHPPNVETVGDAGFYFSGKSGVPDLAEKLEWLINDPALVEKTRTRALERARAFSWEGVADEYERLLAWVRDRQGSGGLPAELIDADAPEPALTRG
jgi:glycosyltransferase involved in cell wall biosynthesis